MTARIRFDVRIPMRDGLTLSADLYLPEGDGPWPAALIRTPYNKNGPNQLSLGRWWAEQGYALVCNDVRGRGDSDGTFVPYRHEGIDGYDTIEWTAAQDWCDGSVGTLGGSYLGHAQWLAALEQPPHLRAMIVLVTPSDPFGEWPTGTPGPMHLCWLHYTSGRLNQNMDAVDWTRVYEHLPLRTMDQAAGRFSPQWRDELDHPTLDGYWAPLCYQEHFSRLSLPVLHISGWYDDEQVGTPRNFAGMVAQAATPEARRAQKLLMGPWGHAVNESSRLGEVDFGPGAVIDLRGYEERFFARWLKGADNGVDREPPVRLFVMGANVWREEQEWPPARAQTVRYYLRGSGRANSRFGDGQLSQELPAAEAPDTYDYDPRRPVPFLTAPTSSQIGGPDDYSGVLQRGDVLWYVTPPLDRDVEVTGPLAVELYASSSAPDTDFTAMLCDVWPTGFVQRLADGIVRSRYRDGLDAAQRSEPGRVYGYSIDLWHTSQRFRAGHRIGLMVASSAFPKYDRNLNTGGSLADGTEMQVAHQTVHHSAEYPSAVLLPIVAQEPHGAE